jgi:aspartyl-tRNA synthetase
MAFTYPNMPTSGEKKQYYNFFMSLPTFIPNKEISAKGPVGKFFKEDALKKIMQITSAEIGDSIFFSCGKLKDVEKLK